MVKTGFKMCLTDMTQPRPKRVSPKMCPLSSSCHSTIKLQYHLLQAKSVCPRTDEEQPTLARQNGKELYPAGELGGFTWTTTFHAERS